MAEEWRELALTVPGTLMLVGTSEKALGLLELAEMKFDVCADLMCMLRLAAIAARPGYVDGSDYPAPLGDWPTVFVEDARRDISHRGALQAKAGHVLLLYRAHVGLQGDDPLWQSLDVHHTAALSFADQALGKVVAAASSAAAAQDAIAIAEGLPSGSPLWIAWILAAERLLNGARNDVVTAMALMCRMHHAVVLEFFDAWMILNR